VSLEEVYLRLDRALPQAASTAPPTVPARQPAERLAPGQSLLRMLRYELGHRFAGGWAALLLLLPAAVAALAVWMRHRQAAVHAEQVASGTLISTTQATAFEAIGIGLQAGLPLLALILAALGSQAIAGETSSGTLRNVALRPLRRWHIAAGKMGYCVLAASLGHGLLCAMTGAAAGLWFRFDDVAEVLPNGAKMTLVAAADLYGPLLLVVLAPILPLCAYVTIGFFAGAVTNSAAAALGLALGGVIGLDLGRVLARAQGFERWLPSAYMPSPLGDTSYLAVYQSQVQGVSNVPFTFADTSHWVPLAWGLLLFLGSAWSLGRRSIR
jgi:hypothetical protein